MNNTDEIEFSRVRKLVSHYAVSPEAKDKILVQPLATKLVKATALLDETAEMVWILNHGLRIPFISSDALTPILNKVKKGFILNPAELEQVADFIRVTRLLVRFFNKQRNNTCLLYTSNLLTTFIQLLILSLAMACGLILKNEYIFGNLKFSS